MSKQENVTFDRECQSEGIGPLDKQCLSRELKGLLNIDEDVKMTRGQVVRSVWNYIEEHQLKDPNNGRYIIPDEKMSTVFGKEKFLGFAMAKYLEKHYKRENNNDKAGEGTSSEHKGSNKMADDFAKFGQTVDKKITEIGADLNSGFSSFGNKMREFSEGGCTRNEYIGFGVTFGILVTAVLVAGMAVAYGNGLNGITGYNLQDFDTEAFDKAYIDLEKFGNYVEKTVDNARVDFEKFRCDMQEENVDATEGIHIAEELAKLGQIVEEKIDVAEVKVKEEFDRAGEEFEQFGQIVEEKIDVTEENIKEGLVHAGEELEKFGQNIEEKMDEAEAKIKEGLFHAGEELEKLGQNIQEKFEKEK